MKGSAANNVSKNTFKFFGESIFFLAIGSLCALFATFFVSVSNFQFQSKLLIFLSVLFLYTAFCACIYARQKKHVQTNEIKPVSETSESIFNAEIEAKLLAFEEANQFFGASLKPADMFRLVASRIEEIIPFAACAVFFADQENNRLKIVYAVGENSEKLIETKFNSSKGLAGKTFQNRQPQLDEKLLYDINAISIEKLKGFSSAIAVPLFHNEEVFGVLELFGAEGNKFDKNTLQLFEAIGTRVAPLFLSSRAFEISLANALTDALTSLPNERAFFLVLENQIAESQRFRDNRPLAILTIDIKNFAEINEQYGHATGDRVLEYAAEMLKNQLRQMDFLARSVNDEFLAVLPTASDEITKEIIERVEKAFVSKPFEVLENEKIYLQLNFGAASFGKDGETLEQLLELAILRKQQSKSTESGKILWFPKEFVN